MRIFASKELIKKRISICNKCELKKENRFGDSCGTLLIPTDKTCGCFIKSKASIHSSKCPSGKW